MPVTFHPLKLLSRERIAEDAVTVSLEIPDSLREEFRFEPGQHLALRATLDGREVRRTYSIVNGSQAPALRLGIRVQSGQGLSRYLSHQIKVGGVVEVMRPTGRFRRSLKGGKRTYLAVAAGSGITPILSILTAVLESDPDSRFLLIYGNRTSARAMFVEELLALKNQHLGRFAIHFLMSREPQEMGVFNGRADGARIHELAGTFFDPGTIDEVFLCGPGELMSTVREALVASGTLAPIHFERFASPSHESHSSPVSPTSAAATTLETQVTIVQDGRRKVFAMRASDVSLLDAAERAGLALPYSCRAGVCSTCRAKVVRGAVTMGHNVALEAWEVAAGFVLCCQAVPATSDLELTYDEK